MILNEGGGGLDRVLVWSNDLLVLDGMPSARRSTPEKHHGASKTDAARPKVMGCDRTIPSAIYCVSKGCPPCPRAFSLHLGEFGRGT